MERDMDPRNIRRPLKLLICLLILGSLASCGQKGELYLPDKGHASLARHHIQS